MSGSCCISFPARVLWRGPALRQANCTVRYLSAPKALHSLTVENANCCTECGLTLLVIYQQSPNLSWMHSLSAWQAVLWHAVPPHAKQWFCMACNHLSALQHNLPVTLWSCHAGGRPDFHAGCNWLHCLQAMSLCWQTQNTATWPTTLVSPPWALMRSRSGTSPKYTG